MVLQALGPAACSRHRDCDEPVRADSKHANTRSIPLTRSCYKITRRRSSQVEVYGLARSIFLPHAVASALGNREVLVQTTRLLAQRIPVFFASCPSCRFMPCHLRLRTHLNSCPTAVHHPTAICMAIAQHLRSFVSSAVLTHTLTAQPQAPARPLRPLPARYPDQQAPSSVPLGSSLS